MLILFLLLSITFTSGRIIDSSSHPSPEIYIKYGGQALNALQRLFNFFEADAKNLNLDGLYGVRIAQGQLNALQQTLSSSTNQQIRLTDKNNIIQSLSTQIERIANISLHQIEHDASLYLHRFSLVASQPFMTEYRSRKIQEHFIENGERSSDFDEEESDKCFGELLGSTDRPNATKCSISQPCWDMMTSHKTKEYRITHQLLWFLVAKDIGCIHQNLANQKLEYLEDYFCANIYADANENLLNNLNQDLFLEQALLCSIIGYEDFLRIDWLQTILAWQHPDFACFSDASETIRFHRQSKRHLLFEQEMNNGCLSHKSGLAAGLLATYSRVFLQ